MLARGIALAATLSAAVFAAFLLDGAFLPISLLAAVGVGLAVAGQRSVRRSAWHAVAVDAGGNWMLSGAAGWRRFRPLRIWRSPLGWLTLQGELAPLPRQGQGPVRVTVTIWADSVEPQAWRMLRIAAAWTEQRGMGLLVSPQARDPRLENPA
ncbi:hypothetical protein PIGHUM_04203 [Pigmentiphaga humi]|uniref:Toxin CptA n=1 Tax=Pigmentiphaga humi TaxID=2478468 RepID=A0A3P4B743_9BURK|nr:hypothetical protein [Pigmentiphaga humi]VCU72107.1 hypothetical protein PIGHUM_04203 [Pigmentiphaga humi]